MGFLATLTAAKENLSSVTSKGMVTDITIKAGGGSITAYSMDKNDCKKIKEILMEFNRTRKGRGIIFA